MKKIIHIDMDAFFASIEERDNPTLKGVPLVVGGDPNVRGVVATANYTARQFGIRSAMSCRHAKTLCPDVVFIRPRFEVYRQTSLEIRKIMQTLTDKIEPLSLDEAYLDVSDINQFHGSATLMAQHLCKEIYQQTHLTASAGVSFNKMLAKIASDLNKPNGITTIAPKDASAFIDGLAIEKFFGIGKATAKQLRAMNIHTGADLKQADVSVLVQKFGKRGQFYYDIAHLKDEREVKTRVRKSVGSEITLPTDLSDDSLILKEIFAQAQRAWSLLQKHKQHASTLSLKLKYSDFSQITRSKSYAFDKLDTVILVLTQLYADSPKTKAVRLVGVSFSNFSNQSSQLVLFD